jgi:hypothetical protein
MNILTLEHKSVVETYNIMYNIRMSELNFTNLFAWQEKYRFHIDELNGYMILINVTDTTMYFSQLIGPLNNLTHLKDTIYELMATYNLDKLILKKSNHYFKTMLESSDLKIEIKEIRDDFDYLYDFKSMKELRGNMYHKKKNHVNQFTKNYDWTHRLINSVNISDIYEVMKVWFTEDTKDMIDEKRALQRVIDHWEDLSVVGSILYVDEVPIAFAIGEIIHEDTLLMHFEKADRNFQGAYEMITNCFLKNFEDLKYVNREQDLGIPGLRKSKLSYHPVDFNSKYNIVIYK